MTCSDLEQLCKRIRDEGLTEIEVRRINPSLYTRYRNTVKDTIEDSMKFRDVEILVYSGPTGTGKTRKAVDETDYMIHDGDLYWWNGYNGEKSICIDLFNNRTRIKKNV